ncbi:hypothetical protein Gogos_016200 [Gossypium gossypioides]|uniref:Uncharacterized protein n=1 Tax=Gossypium gossypioides TaxID=34282 RepID=A0A7J9B740_GOSGO|nr:hypothetical protein [Gossypium gossypioides]
MKTTRTHIFNFPKELFNFFQQVILGIIVITFYAPILFRTIGQCETVSLMPATVTSLVGTIATFI